VCKHLKQCISGLTYKHVVLHKTAGSGVCQEYTYPGHAQTQPCTELRISIPCSYAEVHVCIRSTQANSALICKLAERYRSICLFPLTGLCMSEPCRSVSCWVCAETVYTDLQDTAVLYFLANLILQIFTEMHSFSNVHYPTT